MGIEIALALSGPALIGTALAGAGLYMQYEQGEEAKKQRSEQAAAQQRSQAAQDRASAVAAQRERLQQVRQSRIAQAQIINTSTQKGMGTGTSGVAGGTASATSQTGANIGSINVAQSFGQEASMWNSRAAAAATSAFNAQSNAQMWGNISNVGMSIFQGAGGFSMFKTPVAGAEGTK